MARMRQSRSRLPDDIFDIAPYRLLTVGRRLEFVGRLECQSNAGERPAELLHRNKTPAGSRIDNLHAALAQLVEDDKMRKLPM